MLEPYARDTFDITLDGLTGDWSGWTFKGDIRVARDHTSTLIVSFAVDTSRLASDGVVVFSVPAGTMQGLALPTEPWYCDLRARRDVDGHETTFLQDAVRPTENVTP